MSTESLTNLATIKPVLPEEMMRRERSWAIERAIASGFNDERDIVRVAGAFVDFVMGTNDAEIVRAARELAGKVKD